MIITGIHIQKTTAKKTKIAKRTKAMRKNIIINTRTTKPTARETRLSISHSLSPSIPLSLSPTIFFHGEKSVLSRVITENILLMYEKSADKKLKRHASPLPYHHIKNVGTKLM